MNGQCFEPGTIQAFLDGETAPALSYEISGHAAACDACAQVLAAAEEETSFVFAALDREFNSLVPTQRLWTRINDSLAVEKSSATFWEKIRRSLSVFIANPSLTVAASVLIVLGLFAALWNFDSATNGNLNDSVASQTREVAAPAAVESVPITTTGGDQILGTSTTVPEAVKVTETRLSNEKLRNLVTHANYRAANSQPKPQYLVVKSNAATPAAEYIPGEESYVRAITDLKQNVDSQKDTVLTPSSRVAYERDMAVVNDAISKMKEVVRKNPKNQSAKQVLYSSYQNKIDLLNSVADREELTASIR